MIPDREAIWKEYETKDLYIYGWHDDVVFHRTDKGVWCVRHEGTQERLTNIDVNRELQRSYDFPVVITKEEFEKFDVGTLQYRVSKDGVPLY